MKYKIIDLFAGIGGLRLGFEQAAKKLDKTVDCVFSSEIDKYCIQTYITNFGKTNFFGDITKIGSEKDIKRIVPSFDVLLAGFPCQPFSQAGLRKGFSDTRGTLFFWIEKILKVKKPEAFLLENVKHLKGHDKGNTLKTILKVLREDYYVPEPQVLNAKDFGLPQNRERIFIIGFKKKGTFNYPKPNKNKTVLGNILEKILWKNTLYNQDYGRVIKEEREIIKKKETVLDMVCLISKVVIQTLFQLDIIKMVVKF